MDNYVALNKALQFLRQLAEERDVVDKRLIIIGSDKENNHSGHILDMAVYLEGYDPKEGALISDAHLLRVFTPEYASTASKISETLTALNIPGNVKVAEDNGKVIVSAFYEDITFEQLLSIINAYLSCLQLENVDIAVEVTEDQGDGEETKIEDEDYTIFYPDGSHDAYSRKYDF